MLKPKTLKKLKINLINFYLIIYYFYHILIDLSKEPEAICPSPIFIIYQIV